MVCETRMSQLTPPTTTIYGTFFIIGCVFTVLANLLVLVILWMPRNRSRSNEILTSLAVSDLLVGLVVFPINSYEVLATGGLNDCPVDYTRVYFAVFLEGSSVLTLAVIAMDRYILMTKFNIYEKKKTKRLTFGLLVLAWVIPAVAPAFRWVGRVPYLILIFIIFFAPFFILIGCYFLIARALRRQEKLLSMRHKQSFVLNEDQTSEMNLTDMKERDKQTKVDKKHAKTQRSQIKLARAVIFLLIVYFCCVTPKNIWIILYLINSFHPFLQPLPHQNFYIFAMLAVSYNSFFNPIVYFSKNPQIIKGLRKLLRIKRRWTSSATSNSSSYPK